MTLLVSIGQSGFGRKIIRPMVLAGVSLLSAGCASYQLVGFAKVNQQDCRGGSVGRERKIEIDFDRAELKAATAIEVTFIINYKSDTNSRPAIYEISFPQLNKKIKKSVDQIGQVITVVKLSSADIAMILQSQTGDPKLEVYGRIEYPGDWCLTIDLKAQVIK